MLSPEDLTKLDNIYMRSEIANEIFVRKDDCSTKHENLNKGITDIALTLAKTNSQLSILIKISSATLTACGTAIVVAIMNLILK